MNQIRTPPSVASLTTVSMPPKISVSPSGIWPKRYVLLDGFRGIAALMVVFYHCDFLPFGHLGVTLFFVISGYCILASADSCQKQNLGAGEFAWRRFHRIYPPYFCAVVFFIGTRLLKIWFTHENQLMQYSVMQFVQNATLTQWLTLLAHPNATGENPSLMVAAFWSLNYEVQFYAVIGIFILIWECNKRANVNTLIILLTGASLVWQVLMGNIRCGLFIDYWLVFSFGCLVFMRLSKFESRWSRWAVDIFLVVLAAVCLLARIQSGSPDWIRGLATQAVTAGACFSLLLILLRGASERICNTWVGRFICFLGLISYSLYLVHQFNLNLASAVIGHILPAWTPKTLAGAGIIIFHIALATVFWFFCERPFLNGRISFASFFKFSSPKE